MWITRVRVTGGFLGGLDLVFGRGLNVVIGARGSGKTTLLELLRHALGAEHADRHNDARRREFITAVLGSGQVVLDIEIAGVVHQVVVDADGRGRERELGSSILVLGQNELEDIASDAASRMRLLDLRGRNGLSKPPSNAAEQTRTLVELRTRLSELTEPLNRKTVLENDRQLYRAQIAAVLDKSSIALTEDRAAISRIEEDLSRLAIDDAAATTARQYLQEIDSLQTRGFAATDRVAHALANSVRFAETSGLTAQLRAPLERLKDATAEVSRALDRAIADVERESEAARERLIPLRERLDQAEAGLGELSARLHSVESQLRDIEQVEARVHEVDAEYEFVRAERAQTFADIEEYEERLFERRIAVAEEITRSVSHNVIVVVEHLADSSEFRRTLTEAVRGSHTRSQVIDSVTDRVLPRLLLEYVESGDVEGLANTAAISLEQAARLLTALSESSLPRLAELTLDDRVDFLLRDGAVEKSVDSLSTGQKCAVTLPIVLSERDRSLVLDQPEDHLDNAYLVDHIVTGMVHRTKSGVQTIVATHNANIPVLGAAGRVVQLESDGAHGYVKALGAFDEVPIVRAITGLLEGGSEAFERRAAFYAEHQW